MFKFHIKILKMHLQVYSKTDDRQWYSAHGIYTVYIWGDYYEWNNTLEASLFIYLLSYTDDDDNKTNILEKDAILRPVSMPVIPGQWKNDNERLCAMEPRLVCAGPTQLETAIPKRIFVTL